MNEVLSDFVNNPVLFSSAFALIIIGLLVIIITIIVSNRKMSYGDDKVEVKEVIEHPISTHEVSEKEETKKTDIEQLLLKMQEDLEQETASTISTFEQEQEEKSIISYQELLRAAGKSKKEEIDEEIKEDSEVNKYIEQIKGNIKEEKEKKKFKGSEFISPIYGRVTSPAHVDNPNTPIISVTKKEKEIETLNIEEEYDNFDLEKTLNITPLKDEIKRNDAFLKALKDFRKNLE